MVVIERPKKTIMETTQSVVRDETIPLIKRFRTRQAMFRCRWLRVTTYIDTMVVGIKYAPCTGVCNRF